MYLCTALSLVRTVLSRKRTGTRQNFYVAAVEHCLLLATKLKKSEMNFFPSFSQLKSGMTHSEAIPSPPPKKKKRQKEFSQVFDTYFQHDKKVIISVMIIVWNLAFILGFLPLIGWSDAESSCVFFHFFASSYLFFLASCVLVSILVCVCYQILIWRKLPRRRSSQEPNFPDEILQHHLNVAEVTSSLTRWDLALKVVFYLPALLYLVLHCKVCILHENAKEESRVALFLYPLIQIKSICALFVHIRTPQIHTIVKSIISRRGIGGVLVESQGISRVSSLRRSQNSGPASIYTIGRGYSAQLYRRFSKSGSTSDTIVPRLESDEHSTTSTPFHGTCPHCGSKLEQPGASADQALARSPSLPDRQGEDSASDNLEHTPAGQVNAAYDASLETRKSGSAGLILKLEDSTRYRGSFAQTHLFKPQFVALGLSLNKHVATYVPVPREVLSSSSYCFVHGADFVQNHMRIHVRENGTAGGRADRSPSSFSNGTTTAATTIL